MIVVGVDFSDGSAAAATVALLMAAKQREPVHMIHVCASYGFDERSQLDSDEWLERLDLLPADVEVRAGVPWVELVRAAGQRDASFLIAGTHGLTGAQPLRLGTTAALVALRSPTPVVLVPQVRQTGLPVSRAGTNAIEERQK
jgi:nucleotide-binding universal stress UspA family protein